MSGGIYISGMEMPSFGNETIIRIQSGGGILDQYGHHLNCEAVPVPPHGRLGDLDKLVEKIDGIWDCNDMVFKPDDHCCNIPEDCKGCKWAQTKDCIQRMVENALTIIPADTDLENEIQIIDTKGKSNYDPKRRFVISSPTIIPADEGKE